MKQNYRASCILRRAQLLFTFKIQLLYTRLQKSAPLFPFLLPRTGLVR